MMKMLGSGRTVTEDAGVNLHQPGHLQRALHLSQDTKKEAPLVPSGGICSDLKRVFLYCHTENVTPFIPAQITNPPLVFFFPVSFVFHSLLWSATCTEWFNLVWWEQPARKETEGDFAWLITTPLPGSSRQWVSVWGTQRSLGYTMGPIHRNLASGSCIRHRSLALLAWVKFSAR